MSWGTSMANRRASDDPLLNIDEAAEYLSITKATLYTWRSRRSGYGPPATKVGGCLRYRRSALDAWIDAHTEAVTTTAVPDESQRGKAPHPASGIPLTRKVTRR